MKRDLLMEFSNKMSAKGYLFEAVAELTHACNLRCIHCYVDQENRSPELSVQEWKTAIDRLVELGLCMITFTGGEPFLFKGLRELVAYAFKNNVQPRIFTNGTMFTDRDQMRDLKEAGLCYLETSIYGVDAEVHDKVTAIPGSFERVMQAIEWANEFGIPVTIKSVWIKQNRHQYKEIVEKFKGMGLHFRGSPSIMPNWSTEENIACRLSHEELVELYREEETLAGGAETEADRLTEELRPLDVKPCGIGANNLNIGPDGTLFPCNHLRTPIGNILTDDLAHIWRNDPELNRLREIHLADYSYCDGCTYRNDCFICMGDGWVEHGDVLKPPSEACILAKARYEAARKS